MSDPTEPDSGPIGNADPEARGRAMVARERATELLMWQRLLSFLVATQEGAERWQREAEARIRQLRGE